jgi:GT2 family glycosyltransferase
MKFSLAIPVLNQKEEILETLNSYYSLAKYPEDIPLILIDNGSNPTVASWIFQFTKNFPLVKLIVHRNAENIGVTKSLNQIWELSKGNCCKSDFIFYSHSDVIMQEQDWDVKLLKYLTEISAVGVIGFGGAKGIGSPELYKEPYVIWQLVRTGFFSNMQDAEIHGRRMINEIEPCAVLDGFSLIVNTKLLEETNGFDEENYPIHHMYDNDICLESIKHGYFNFVLNIKCHHKGGITATRGDYDKWLRNQGIEGDSEIHRKAHENFYEKWRGFIPLVFYGGRYIKI